MTSREPTQLQMSRDNPEIDCLKHSLPLALETELADARSDLTDQNGIGWMTDGQWMALYDYLLEFDALPNSFDYKEAFTDSFLRGVYDEGELSWP